MQVGVRQLRDELRKWLEAVPPGDEVIVTERGKPIARLIGASTPTTARAADRGWIRDPAERPRRPTRAHPRVRGKGSVSDLVADQRR